MPSLIIDDFLGGRNTLDAPNMVPQKQHTAGQNVWAEYKALSKRRGATVAKLTHPTTLTNYFSPDQLKVTSLAAGGLTRLVMVGYTVISGSAYEMRCVCKTDNGTTIVPVGYSVGTCSTAGSSMTVTGAGGTLWATHARINDFILVGSALHKISAVNSDTEIVISAAVTLAGGTAYTIIHALSLTALCAVASFDVSSAENVFITDGSATGKIRYDGTNAYVVTYIPTGTIALIPHKNYLFSVRATTIEWSALKDATTWPATNTQTVTGATDPLRGGIVFGDSIVLFTRSRMFRLLGDTFDPANPTYVLQEIPVPNGFSFGFSRSACVHKGVLKFLTADGWFAYDGNIVKKISQDIQPDVDTISRPFLSAEVARGTGANAAVAFSYKDRMWVCVTDNSAGITSVMNTVFVQDERGAWWKWVLINTGLTHAGLLCDFALVKFSSTFSFVGAGGNTLLTLDTGYADCASDATATDAIDGTWTSKEFSSNDEITFVEAVVTLKKQTAGNLTVSFSIDRATFTDKTCDMTTGVGTVIQKRIPLGRSGKTIRIKVRNGVVDQQFEVYKIEIIYKSSKGTRV